MTPKWHPNVILRFKKRYDMISSAKEEKRFAAGKERKRVQFRPPAGRAAFGVLSSLRGKAEKYSSIKKPFPVLERLFLMRWNGKNVRVRRGSMSEDLGGGEGGLNPLDAQRR